MSFENFTRELFGFKDSRIKALQQIYEITDADVEYARMQTNGTDEQTLYELEDMIKRNQFKKR